jgi:hypothetical protein
MHVKFSNRNLNPRKKGRNHKKHQKLKKWGVPLVLLVVPFPFERRARWATLLMLLPHREHPQNHPHDNEKRRNTKNREDQFHDRLS